MNAKQLAVAAVFVCGLASPVGLPAQEAPATARPAPFPKLPDASPDAEVRQRVGLTDIQIRYSRPSMNHHQVFGGIVPYGDVLWRTGDNASTKINFSTPVKLNGVDVPAGMYALYTIPVSEKEWTVIIYKDPGLWGTEGYDASQELARIKVTPVALKDPVETFTIDVNDIRDDSATLNLRWGLVRVPIKLEVDLVPELLVKIDAAMEAPGKKKPEVCLQAATFYFNHTNAGDDMTKVLRWVNEGLLDNPPIAYQLLYVKAEILARQRDNDGARDAAQQSTSLAIQAEGPSTPYVKLNREVIVGLRQ